ncbi:MAG: glycogen/starch synthase [Candidatus Rokubacteria bacterium]|nr:glycogen/starch synthase [Candidatus Rokubacteria bacterium]
MPEIIAFVAYESPWAPAGGIAAVMGRLPPALLAAAKRPTIAITPFHHRSARTAGLATQHVGNVQVGYGRDKIPVAVLRHDAGCPWYFLQPAAGAPAGEPPFFGGERHPYDVPMPVLLRDALFFGAAAGQALAAIDESARWDLLLQDWEAATAALAVASQQQPRSERLRLTLHNTYDAFAPLEALTRVGIDPQRCPGDTILQRALGLVESPVFTVSEQFALDLTDDLLQRRILAPHLQDLLARRRVLGVDNGPFTDLRVDPALLGRAAAGEPGPLAQWKAEQQRQALAALAGHAPSDERPVWGDPSRFRRDDSPWFVMAGRDDPRQKGYDVAALAIDDYLSGHQTRRSRAQFLFFPVPGDEGLAGLTFLKALAERHPEDVLVLPFIWQAGFMAALQGAAYALMPSLYEPFGMANEFYLQGCVGIGRATGGIVEQIVPLRGAAAFGEAVRARTARFHPMSAPPTGLLFREPDDIDSALADWMAIHDARYDKRGGSPSRVEERGRYTVIQAMVGELRVSIEDAVKIVVGRPELYYRMLAEGVGYIGRTFSWERAAHEYARRLA